MPETLEQQFERYKRNFIQNFEKAGMVLAGEMINTVAQKTRKLELSIKADRAIVDGNTVEVRVGSEGVHYAFIVEAGVQGKVYQYHRLTGGASRNVVWVGVGQQWAERSLIAKGEEILSIIQSTRI